MKNYFFLLIFITQICYAQEYDRVVLIVADDLGARDLACYGNTFIETPHLDALSMSGTKLDRAYASGPICSPTRASILTGLAPARLGMTEHLRGEPPILPSQRLIPPENTTVINKDLPTIPKMFSTQGYHTAIIGKWHLGGGEQNPDQYGYDHTYASSWPGLPPTYFYPFFGEGVFPELIRDSKEGDYLTDVLANEAERYIREKLDTSYFLHVNFYSPHVPIMARQDLLSKYDSLRNFYPEQKFPNIHYAAMVEAIDQGVGKIIEALMETGEMDRTLIVFTSDHGGLHVEEVPAFAMHTPPTDNGELRGGKGYLYEGGIRVPWIMNHDLLADMQNPPVASADLFNIFAELIGSEERTLDGADLSQLSTYTKDNPRSLHWHFPHYSPQQGRPESAIIRGDYKLIRHYEGSYDELFEIQNNELFNKANIDLEKTEELSQSLNEWLATVEAKEVNPNPNYYPVAAPFSETFELGENGNSRLEFHLGGVGFYSGWNKYSQGASAKITTNGDQNYWSSESDEEDFISYCRQLNAPYDLRKNQQYYFLIDYKHKTDQSLVAFTLRDINESEIIRFESTAGGEGRMEIGQESLSLTLPENVDSIVAKLVLSDGGEDSLFLWTGNFTDLTTQSATFFTGINMDEGIRFAEKVCLESKGSAIINGFKGGKSPSAILENYEAPKFSPVSESFDYEAGTSLNNKGNNEVGWGGPWLLQGSLNGNESEIANGNIEVENGIVLSGNRYEVTYKSANTKVRLDRALNGPIRSDGSTYWISYLSDVGEDNAPNNVSNLSLINTSRSGENAMLLSIGRLYGNRKIGLSTPADGQRIDLNKFDIGTHWIVCKIVTNEDEVNDEYFLWVDPSSEEEPQESEADAVLSSAVLDNIADAIRIRTEGAGNNQTPLNKSFDEIRISTQWEDLVSSISEIIPEVGAIKVFPNPIHSVLNYELSLEKYTEVESYLLDINGDTIQTFSKKYLSPSFQKISETIDPIISSGTYFLHLRFDDKKFTKKIIIVRS